jgi:hypothetical protein
MLELCDTLFPMSVAPTQVSPSSKWLFLPQGSGQNCSHCLLSFLPLPAHQQVQWLWGLDASRPLCPPAGSPMGASHHLLTPALALPTT